MASRDARDIRPACGKVPIDICFITMSVQHFRCHFFQEGPQGADRTPIEPAMARNQPDREVAHLGLLGNFGIRMTEVMKYPNTRLVPNLIQLAREGNDDTFRAIKTAAANQMENSHLGPFFLSSLRS